MGGSVSTANRGAAADWMPFITGNNEATANTASRLHVCACTCDWVKVVRREAVQTEVVIGSRSWALLLLLLSDG